MGRPSSINSPSTLHMSGGGVYTTDSYYRKLGPPITSTTSSGSRLPAPAPTSAPAPAAPQLSVIKKLPVSTAAPMPAKKRSVIKSPSVPTKKRSHDSPDNDHNQGSKRARNDLVIEKIPRKNANKEQTEQSNLQTNEQALDCKLVISRLNKKAKLVFENGIEVPISKNIFKHIL